MRYNKEFFIKIIDIIVCTFISAGVILAIVYFLKPNQNKTLYVMGGSFENIKQEDEATVRNVTLNAEANERYFRPSRLKAINTREFPEKFYKSIYVEKTKPEEIKIPQSALNSPENTIINFYSLLREAENLTKDKAGGCGTVGEAKSPYPAAYAILSDNYKSRLPYNEFLKSFEGIGHINLIKLEKAEKEKLHPDSIRYFIELETIEGSNKGVTYFAYYYGFIYVNKEGASYRIADINLSGEDFLCAPYHGWSHWGESIVDIKYGEWCKLVKERKPAEKNGYVKTIYVNGTDKKEYKFLFFQLTNGTDLEIEQYVKAQDGRWIPIDIDTDKCLQQNFATAKNK